MSKEIQKYAESLFKQRPPIEDPNCPHPVYDGGNRFYAQTKRIGGEWPIKENDIVLDVGPGHTPFPYARLLMDRYPNDNKERLTDIPRDGRIIIKAGLEEGLPLADKSVDFAYCSHLLEHANDPTAVCEELQRVARRGFVEVPSINLEIFWNNGPGVHKWVVEPVEGCLVFRKYSEPADLRKMAEDERTGLMIRYVSADVFKGQKYGEDPRSYVKRFADAYWARPELFTDIFLWEDGFEVKVEK